MVKSTKKMAAIVMAISLLLSGCGGKEEGASDSTVTEPEPGVSNQASAEETGAGAPEDGASEGEPSEDGEDALETPEEDRVLEWISSNGEDRSRVESWVRTGLGIREEDIRLSDVWDITELDNIPFPLAEEISDWANLPNLKILKADGNSVENIDVLAELPGLTELTLINCWDLKDISALSELSDLTVLNLDGCRQITDISVLASLTELTQLSLRDAREIKDISVLAELKKLRTLDISGTGVSDISVLSELPELVDLTITGPEMFNGVSALPNLEAINQKYDQYSEARYDFGVLESLPNLTKLSLQGIDSANSNIADVAMLQNLESLELSGCGGFGSLLLSVPNLKELTVAGMREENPWDNLTALTKLETLSLERISGDFSALSGSESLRTLRLIVVEEKGEEMADCLSGITNLPNLTRLEVSERNLAESFGITEILKSVPKLKELSWVCPYSVDVSCLTGVQDLTSLELDYRNGIDSLDLGVLSELSNLTELNLSLSKETFDATDFSVLAQSSSLTTLGLRIIQSTGEVDLSCLSNLTNLRSLDLSGCQGIRDISPLSGLTGLETLDLSSTGVTDFSPVSFVPVIIKGNRDFFGGDGQMRRNKKMTALLLLPGAFQLQLFFQHAEPDYAPWCRQRI